MILYHGASADRLKSILASGLRPWGTAAGNWERYESRDDMVYLSDVRDIKRRYERRQFSDHDPLLDWEPDFGRIRFGGSALGRVQDEGRPQ
jgi:predicted phosphohydrolase